MTQTDGGTTRARAAVTLSGVGASTPKWEALGIVEALPGA